MSFPKDSFVWLGACTALASVNRHFVDALIGAGAGVVWAWTSGFNSETDYHAALYVFDRMLGLNVHRREGPPQRPFDYASIKANMAPWDTDQIGSGATALTSQLLFVSGGRNAPAGLLAPSIKNMYVDEDRGLLVLSGKFGSEMGTAQVAGIDRTVESWTEDTVKINLPATGTGTAGEVVVFSRGRRSNVRPLTEWRGEFIWTFINTPQPDLQWAGLIRVHIRADVHDYRNEHRQAPIRGRTVRFACANDTNGSVTGSGDHGQAPNVTSWRGTSHMVSRLLSPGPNTIDCVGEIDTEAKVLRLFLAATALQGMTVNSTSGPINLPAVWAHPGEGALQAGPPLPAMTIPMTQTWNITAGTRKLPGPTPTQSLDWGVIQPTTRTAPADSMPR
jgi:hypothetical protein